MTTDPPVEKSEAEKLVERLRDYQPCLQVDVVICDRRTVDEAATMIEKLAAHPQHDREAIARLAERFWRVHPKELQDAGITRQQFYEREMLALIASG
jgi:hypothetical protein